MKKKMDEQVNNEFKAQMEQWLQQYERLFEDKCSPPEKAAKLEALKRIKAGLALKAETLDKLISFLENEILKRQ